MEMEIHLKQEPTYSSESILPVEEVEIPTEIKTEPDLTIADESNSGCHVVFDSSSGLHEADDQIIECKSNGVIDDDEESNQTAAKFDSDLEHAQQQFVIVSEEAQSQKYVNAVSVETLETSPSEYLQPSKYIRLQGENGQVYVLAISGNTASNNSLSQTVKVPSTTGTDTRALTDTSGFAVSKSPERKQSKPAKTTCPKDDVTQAWFTTRDDKNTLQNNGHTWKQGQWTKAEVELLKKNIDNYCHEREIQDATEIIFQMSKDERKDFYRTVAKGLERPLFSVYRRVTRMYDQKNHVGRYSPEEMEKLRDLRVTYGNDWISIGQALGRSASSVKDKCRLMKEKCNSGKWLQEEERRLTAAVYDLAKKKPGEQVTSGLSWALVSEKVGTRSEKQCRTKWLNYLNWKEVGGTEWTRQDDIRLVIRLSELNVDTESDIDWNDLCQGWPSARSPQWLRGKWWSLKRHINDYQNLSFSHLVTYLKSIYLQIKHVSTATSESDLDVTMSVPITLQSAVIPDSTTVEVLHEWPTTDASGSLVISNHETTSTSGLTLAGSSLPSEHIIVQTFPLHIEKVNENVTVQVNPQVIVSTDSTDDECHSSYANIITQSLELPLKVEQDLNSLSQHRDLDDGCLDSSVVKYEVLSSNETFESHTVTDSGLPSEGVQADIEHSVQSDIVQSEGESSNLDW